MTNARFEKAEREYYDPPDDDLEDCETCESSGKVDHDCETCNEGLDDHLFPCGECEGSGKYKVDCENCEGHGSISKAQKRQDFLDMKADYDYQIMKDRKFEGGF